MTAPAYLEAPDRDRLRRLDMFAFLAAIQERHPELRSPVTFPEFTRIAHREHITVKIADISRPARLLRYGPHFSIRLRRSLDYTARTRFGMHELVHYWRDDIGEACFHADDEWLPSDSEDFAEDFAWLVTCPAFQSLDLRSWRRS